MFLENIKKKIISLYSFAKKYKGRTYCSAKFNIPNARILVLCDLHHLEDGEIDVISSVEYDFCVLLGDIPFDALAQVKELVNKPIYAIGGNHDTRDMYKKFGIDYINARCINVDGLTIAGIEGSNRYKKSDEFVMLSQEESIQIAKHLDTADILISHDSCFKKYGTSPNKCGLKGISRYIKKYKPTLHLHGHYHIYDKYKIGNTLCLACYRCMLVDTNGNVEKVF